MSHAPAWGSVKLSGGGFGLANWRKLAGLALVRGTVPTVAGGGGAVPFGKLDFTGGPAPASSAETTEGGLALAFAFSASAAAARLAAREVFRTGDGGAADEAKALPAAIAASSLLEDVAGPSP